MVNSGQKKTSNLFCPEHGIKGYSHPNAMLLESNYKSRIHKFSKEKREIAYKIKRSENKSPETEPNEPVYKPKRVEKGWVPGTYHNSQIMKKNLLSKTPKILFTRRVMMQAIKDGTPGPMYDFKDSFENCHPDNLKKYICQEEKMCAPFDEAAFHGMQSPGYKYTPGYNWIDKYNHPPTMFEESERELEKSRVKPIEKEDGVSPAHYNTIKAFKRSQEHIPTFHFMKGEYLDFIEEYKKQKRFLPGVGHYEYDPKRVHNFLSRSPREL